MKRQESIGNLVAGTLRENADRNPVFDFSDAARMILAPCFRFLAVKEQAVQIFHPVAEKRDFQHLQLGNIAGRAGNAYVSHKDVKITPVVFRYRGQPGL